MPVDDMDWFASDARSCERLAGCASTGIQIFNSIAATAGRSCHNLNSTQFQTTATTLLIIFLQSCKYSITKPSLNPPCLVHNAHVFVRHILIQNLLVAVQCLDMKCSIVRMQDLVRADWHRAFQLPLHALTVFPTCSMTFAPNPGFLKCFE